MALKFLKNLFKSEPEAVVLQDAEELIKHLELRFPDTIPRTVHTNIEGIRILQGNREVIDYIRDLVGSGKLDEN